jgi:hypothetical protein
MRSTPNCAPRVCSGRKPSVGRKPRAKHSMSIARWPRRATSPQPRPRGKPAASTSETRRDCPAMKLLFLTPQLPFPPRQGTTIRNFNLIRWLAPHHTIDLLTFLAPGEETALGQPAARVVPAHRDRARSRSAPPRCAPALRCSARRRIWRCGWKARRCTRWLRRGQQRTIVTTSSSSRASSWRSMDAAPASAVRHRPALVFDDHNCEYLLQQRNALTDLRTPRRWIAAGYSLVQWQKLRRYEAATVQRRTPPLPSAMRTALALLAVAPGAAITVAANGIDLAYDPAAARHANADPRAVGLHRQDGLSPQHRRGALVCPDRTAPRRCGGAGGALPGGRPEPAPAARRAAPASHTWRSSVRWTDVRPFIAAAPRM